MRVCAIIPIGDLSLFGYNRFWKTTLEIQQKNFDKIYLVSTSRSNRNLKFEFNNVELIYNEELLFDLDENEREIINIYKIYKAEDYVMSLAKIENFDFALRVPINSYFPPNNFIQLKDYLTVLKKKDVAVGYNHKAFQFGNKLFYSNTSLPSIINLKLLDDISVDIDVVIFKEKRYPYRPINGMTSNRFFIDILGSESKAELEHKYNTYVKGYLKDWKGVEKNFNEEDIIKEIANKISKLKLNKLTSINTLNDVYEKCYDQGSIYYFIDRNRPKYYKPTFMYLLLQYIRKLSSYYLGNR